MKHSLIDVLTKEGHPLIKIGEDTFRVNPCPVCGGNDHFTYYKSTDSYNSFSDCSKGGDVYNYLQETGQVKNYQEAIVYLENSKMQRADIIDLKIAKKNDCEYDFTQFIQEIHEQGNNEYFYSRGLSSKIIEQYKLGFLPKGLGTVAARFKINEKINYFTEGYRFLLPCWNEDDTCNYFITRLDETAFSEVPSKVPKTHNLMGYSVRIFNDRYIKDIYLSDRILFITEGIFDALSLEELGYKAIALNSVTNLSKLIKLIEENKEKVKHKVFVLIADNDEAGRNLIDKAERKFKKLKIPLMVTAPPKYKDINEMLMNDRSSFEKFINELVVQAKNIKNKTKSIGHFIEESITGHIKFKHYEFAQWFMEERYFLNHNDQLYMYKKGIYEAIRVSYLKGLIQKELGRYHSKRRVDEVTEFIKNNRVLTDDEFFSYIHHEPHILNLKNGLLNIKTGELKPHSPSIIRFAQFDVKHDVGADCALFTEYLEFILPDEDDRKLLYQMMGYAFYQKNHLQTAFLLVGSGANGKSVALDVLTAMLGHKNVSSVELQKLGENTFASSRIVGKYANIDADIPPTHLRGTSIIKKIITGDAIDVERKGKDGFSYRPCVTLIFSCNEMPTSSDNSDGFFRRWIIVEFPVQIPKEKKDIKLTEKIILNTVELSGIFNRSIEALKEVLERGQFIGSTNSIRRLEQLKENSDHIKTFLEECLCVSEEKGARTRSMELYKVYGRWCKENGYRPTGNKNFTDKMALKGIEKKKTTGNQYFIGVTVKKELREEWLFDFDHQSIFKKLQ